jgi:hypothetical protein
MIGQDADVFQSKVNEDLRADTAFVLHHPLARRFPVELAARMEVNLRQGAGLFGGVDGEAATRVVQIQEHAAVFLGDGLERSENKLGAVADNGTENITGQAMGVNPH